MPRNERDPQRLSPRHIALVQELVSCGTVRCGRYLFTVEGPVVRVRDAESGHLVAYSCLRSSLDESIEEFVRTYA